MNSLFIVVALVSNCEFAPLGEQTNAFALHDGENIVLYHSEADANAHTNGVEKGKKGSVTKDQGPAWLCVEGGKGT